MAKEFIRYANSFQTIISLRLERITALLEEMGNPQRGLRFIHVAGTNGKGSVCAFLDAMLRSAGIRAGRFTSPNLIRVNERITVGGEEIPDGELNPLLEEIGALCPVVEKKVGELPSQFEVWTAAAMEYFSRKKCGLVILEVGMGGEFDATNVIEKNELAVITRIALDHCAFLGNTEAEIARTKCGIFKEGCAAIAVQQSAEVNAAIAECAAKKHNRLTTVAIPESKGFEDMYERFDLGEMKNLVCGLGGLHQLENAALAAAAAAELGLSEEAIRRGLASAKHPARLERLAEGVIFDGAHNPNGVEALVSALERYFPEGGQTVIFACMKDKDVLPSLKKLNTNGRRFIFTCVRGNPRSMSAAELKALAHSGNIEGEAYDEIGSALSRAAEIGKPCVICGSLYLYESAAEAVKNRKTEKLQ